MRPVMYAFIFAIVLLIFKAFVLDDYIAKNFGDTNVTEESNLSTEVNSASTTTVQPEPQPVIPPETKPTSQENTLSGMATEKQEKKEEPEDKKMPLDKLGDSLSKHIKL